MFFGKKKDKKEDKKKVVPAKKDSTKSKSTKPDLNFNDEDEEQNISEGESSEENSSEGATGVYILEVKMAKGPTQRVYVKGKVTLGSAEGIELQIKGRGLKAKHAIFRPNNDVLSIHTYAGDIEQNGNQLASGKMYILEEGDKLTLGELDIIIRYDELDAKEFDDPKTNIKSILEYKEELEEAKEKEKLSNLSFLEKAKNWFKRNKKGNEKAKPQKGLPKKNLKMGMKSPKERLKIQSEEKLNPGPLLRIMGFPILLVTIYSLIYIVLPLLLGEDWAANIPFIKEGIFTIRESIFKFLASLPHLKQAEEFIHLDQILKSDTPFYFVSFAIFIELIFAFLIGSSFGHFIMGIESDDNFALKRIKSFARLILWPISAATIVGELLPLFGQRTLKEILTLTHLKAIGSGRRFLGVYLILPGSILFATVGPLLLAPDFWEGPYEIAAPPESKKIAKDNNIPAFFDYSEFFNGRYKIAGEFELFIFPIIKADAPKDSYVLFYDKEKNITVVLEKIKTPEIDFKKFSFGNPVLFLFHPNFENEIKGNPELEQSLLSHAANIQVENFVEYLLEFGPFTLGLVKVREQLKEFFKISGHPEIYRIKGQKLDLWAIRDQNLNAQNYLNLWNMDKSYSSFRLEFPKDGVQQSLKILNNVIKQIGFGQKLKESDKKNPHTGMDTLDSFFSSKSITPDEEYSQVSNNIKKLKDFISTSKITHPQVLKSLEELKTFYNKKWGERTFSVSAKEIYPPLRTGKLNPKEEAKEKKRMTDWENKEKIRVKNEEVRLKNEWQKKIDTFLKI